MPDKVDADVRLGFTVEIWHHTHALRDRTPDDIRCCIANALEQSEKPSLQEEVDFTITVRRIYGN